MCGIVARLPAVGIGPGSSRRIRTRYAIARAEATQTVCIARDHNIHHLRDSRRGCCRASCPICNCNRMLTDTKPGCCRVCLSCWRPEIGIRRCSAAHGDRSCSVTNSAARSGGRNNSKQRWRLCDVDLLVYKTTIGIGNTYCIAARA